MVDRSAVDSGLFLATDFAPENDALLAFNVRGTRLAVSCKGGEHILVFNPHSGHEVARLGDFRHIHGITFLSPAVLLVTHYGGCIRCDLRRDERAVLWEKNAWSSTIAVSPNGRDVAIGVYPGLILYDTVKRRIRYQVKTYLAYGGDGYGPSYVPAFSAAGRYVAADLHQDQRGDHLVVVWEAHTGRRQRVFDAKAVALAFRADTLALAVSDFDSGEILLFEPDEGEEAAARIRGDDEARALQFQDSGRTLAALGDHGSLVLLNAATGAVLRRAAPPAGRELNAPVPNADWSLFAAATAGGIVVWPLSWLPRGEPAV